jgi:enamine deaminase RidA (YjgF/YER057c/UK114 family)
MPDEQGLAATSSTEVIVLVQRPDPLQVRTRRRGSTAEIFICAVADPRTTSADLFSQIAARLGALDARILHERIFAQRDDLRRLALERRSAYGDLDDGVAPAWLCSPAGREGPLAGALIHAVAGARPSSLGPHGRRLRWAEGALVVLSGLTARADEPFATQAAAVFARASELLRQGGSALRCVARTWLWVDPIATCYAELNRARTRCFTDSGLIAADGTALHLPASTGIGLRPATGHLGLDAIATGDGVLPTTWLALGNQRSAFDYGSAFSRAARARTLTGDVLYVSGTAAIDAAGCTLAPGDAAGQIAATLANVRAVLRHLRLGEQEIVHGVVYAATPDVAEAWRRGAPSWPHLVVLAEVCRADLLFEIEVTACPGLA